MKKCILTVLLCLYPFCASYARPVFNETDKIVMASAKKLGRGKTSLSETIGKLNKEGTLSLKCDVAQCQSCSSENYCVKCESGYYAFNGMCYSCPANATCDGGETPVCKSGYAYNASTQKCVPCATGCSTCSAGNYAYCLTCKTGYYLNSSNSCVSCSSAVANCASCHSDDGKSAVCDSCKTNYSLSKNTCVYNGTCTDTNCLSCPLGPSTCSSCNSEYNLVDGACQAKCPTADMCAADNGGLAADWKVTNCECVYTKKYIMTGETKTYAGKTLHRIKAMMDLPFKYNRKKVVYKTGTSCQYCYDDQCCQNYAGTTCSEYQSTHSGALPEYNCTTDTYLTNEPSQTISLTAAKKGDLGGWIEKEGNLPNNQSDTSWVGGSAMVYGDARVYGYSDSPSLVTDNAIVSGGSVSSGWVYENAKINGGSVSAAEVYGYATLKSGSISDGAKMYGSAISNGCLIGDGGVELYGNADVTGCELHENVKVYGNAKIYGRDVRLWGSVKVYDSAKIKSTSQIYIRGKVNIYGSAQVYATKNWTATSGLKHTALTGYSSGINIGGTVKFCDNSKTSGTYTSGTYYSSWEGSCKPSY